MNYELSIVCAILSGGENRRIGKNKAFLEIGGRPLIEKNIALLKQIFTEITIVTNSPKDYLAFKNEAAVITDKIKDVGPLGGIFSALSSTDKESVFFIACDMPFLRRDMIVRQLSYFKNNDCDALIPRIGVFIEPLHAVYKTKVKSMLNQYIKNNTSRAVRSFLELIDTKYMPIEETPSNRRIFTNINTLSDYKNIIEEGYGSLSSNTRNKNNK